VRQHEGTTVSRSLNKACPSYHLGNSGVKDNLTWNGIALVGQKLTCRTSSSTSLHCVDEVGHGGGGGDAIGALQSVLKMKTTRNVDNKSKKYKKK
jgi:hypothetical protein